MPRKRKVLTGFLCIIILSGLFLVNFIRRQYVVPILMYHSVYPHAEAKNRLAVSTDSFERQMRFLKKNRYNVLPLGEIALLVRAGKNIPPKTVAITFDDGYKDTYVHAFPILKKYGLCATLFIIVNEVERHDRVSWSQIKEMRDSGLVRIGSHTIGPEPLINIKSDAEVKRQIFDSKKAIEDMLGQEVELFSYPEGKFTPQIRQLVIEAGYKAAVATNPGKNYPNDDVFALKRLRISSTCDNLFVFWVESSGYYNFMREHRHK